MLKTVHLTVDLHHLEAGVPSAPDSGRGSSPSHVVRPPPKSGPSVFPTLAKLGQPPKHLRVVNHWVRINQRM